MHAKTNKHHRGRYGGLGGIGIGSRQEIVHPGERGANTVACQDNLRGRYHRRRLDQPQRLHPAAIARAGFQSGGGKLRRDIVGRDIVTAASRHATFQQVIREEMHMRPDALRGPIGGRSFHG